MRRIVCSGNMETPVITAREQKKILDLFVRNSVNVLETYEDSTFDDGIMFNEFIVSTDNTNSFDLGHLLSAIRRLEQSYDIGCSNEPNAHGFYAKDYHFYHYAD